MDISKLFTLITPLIVVTLMGVIIILYGFVDMKQDNNVLQFFFGIPIAAGAFGLHYLVRRIVHHNTLHIKSIHIACLLLTTAILFSFQQTDGWMGKWSGDHPDGITYTITVKDKYKGMNLCEVHAEGIQTFYTLECWATGTPTSLKVYYRSTTDGAFYAKDRVKINQPLFILSREKGKTSWQWQQIFDGKLAMYKS